MTNVDELEKAKAKAEDYLKLLPEHMTAAEIIRNLLTLLDYRTEERDDLQSRVDHVSRHLQGKIPEYILWDLTGNYPTIMGTTVLNLSEDSPDPNDDA